MLMTNYSPLRAELVVHYIQDDEERKVQLVTCNRCGSVVLIDPLDPPTAQRFHDRWHEKLENAK